MSRACCVCEREGLRLFLHIDRCYCLWHLPFDQLPTQQRVYVLRERTQDMRRQIAAARERIRAVRGQEP